MKHGDFTELAKFYLNRVGYSKDLLEYIKNNVQINNKQSEITVADVGAGTGKLTEDLAGLGLKGYAVEPNQAMREEGIKIFNDKSCFIWSEGSAEDTKLPDSCVDWVLMGSSFHWTDYKKSMKEFYRILKPKGYFTAIWNPRDIERNELHIQIEDIVYKEVPNMKRVSSGGKFTMGEMRESLLYNMYFDNMLYMEASHDETMTKERYMNIWKSVNDIQVQAGEEGFKRILTKIEETIKDLDFVEVPYRSRAWTVRSCKK